MAIENHHKVADNIRLEIETAFYTYSQAIEKVRLTESSLSKAADSEKMAMDKYKEGNIPSLKLSMHNYIIRMPKSIIFSRS